MKLRNRLLSLTMLLLATTQLLVLSSIEVFANTNPVVSNVSFTINSGTVTVTYDVSDAQEATVTVYMEVSDDGGTTWNYDYGTASGAIGSGVTAGNTKTITWTYGGAENSNFKIKILADDLFGDQIYYARKIYNTVTIGTQTWLKENLNVGTMIQNTTSGYQQTDNSIIEKYCYNNDEANCATYGGLYEWTEAMQYATTPGTQGICPSGWHIPTYAEMQTLQTYVGNQATKLIDENAKSGFTYTNETGFSALFAGFRYGSGSFLYLGSHTYFWSSTETSGYDAYYMYLYYDSSDVSFFSSYKYYGFSVRCLKD